tara:strand:+ start:2255 stop:3097 length:843 start_codon:yes stop_codon:yes gene_type:complete
MSEENKIRNSIRNAYHTFGKRGIAGITASSRVLPDFIITGTVRSGSTSLYYNICEHPSVLEAAYDEIGYFDSNYHLGENWYRSMFPKLKTMNKIKNNTGYAITGEDTPFYFWKKEVVDRIYDILPDIKLIGIFRNPVDRAYSNYNLGVRMNTEQLGFGEAIDEEICFMEDHSFRDTIDRKRSYISKGIYAEQIKLWLDVFPKEQIHIISTEEMQKQPQDTLGKIFRFLDIPEYAIKYPQKQKIAKYEEMEPSIRKRLLEFYKPHNEKFFQVIKQQFEWNE